MRRMTASRFFVLILFAAASLWLAAGKLRPDLMALLALFWKIW